MIFFTLNCTSNVENSKVIKSDAKEKLLFHSEIGSQNLKIQVLVFDLKTNKNTKELLVELNQEGKIVFSDTLTIEMIEEPMIELRDINGDETDDLLIEYLIPGRGTNKVFMVYLFEQSNVKLNKISNSIYFPNLSYDENLGYISSFRFYGGDAVQMDFLKIESDTLSSKYNILREEQWLYVKKFDGQDWIESFSKLISDDVIIPEIIALEPEVIINTD